MNDRELIETLVINLVREVAVALGSKISDQCVFRFTQQYSEEISALIPRQLSEVEVLKAIDNYIGIKTTYAIPLHIRQGIAHTLVGKVLQENKQFPISACCNASVKVDGVADFPGDKEPCTQCYVCDNCGRPCDLAEWNQKEQGYCECKEPKRYEKIYQISKEIIKGFYCGICDKPIKHPTERIEELDIANNLIADDVVKRIMINKINEIIQFIRKEAGE